MKNLMKRLKIKNNRNKNIGLTENLVILIKASI